MGYRVVFGAILVEPPGGGDGGPAGSLNGLQWLLPLSDHTLAGGTSGHCPANVTVSALMGGGLGVPYQVELRFRGVVELKGYTGGSNDGANFQTGGTPVVSNWNVYRLKITYPGDPDAVFYLNRGTDGVSSVFAIDYTKTFTIKGGSTIELFANAIDGAEIINGFNLSIPGITSPPQPYDGQFIQMNVLSVSL